MTVMIDDRCIGLDVDRSRISLEAEVSGSSYLTGRRTAVARGAIIRDSRLHDVFVEDGASIVDSIIVAEGHAHRHKCDPAGRTVLAGAELPTIGRGASVAGCTLLNSSVARRGRVRDTYASDVCIGEGSVIDKAKLVLVNTGRNVTVAGPTEVSEAYLGHGATIDRRGYYEGVFSNVFRKLRFNASAGRLEVVDRIDLPHLSVYGVNTINSTNSGKLLPQADGVLRGFGKHVGLWHDALLSHEQIELGPCCWVAPWTKVVGQSPAAHGDDEGMVNDELMTYLMPFAMAGVGGDLTRGLVMPGELSVGLGPKQRFGGWVFTYCPDAVIRMVGRLHDALESDRKHVADAIVDEAIRTALEMTKALAARNQVDPSVPAGRQRPGWPRWIAQTYALLNAHLEADLWRFHDGRPTEWRQQDGRWRHPRIERLLAVAPDAIDKQRSEADIFTFADPVPPAQVAVPSGTVGGTGGPAEIDPAARIEPGAFVGPGCRIGPGVVVAAGALVWNSALTGCRLAAGARVERSVLSGCSVGENCTVRSSRMIEASLAEDSAVTCAAVTRSRLARQAAVTAFADVAGTDTQFGTILGGRVHDTRIETYLMTMHMAGACDHLRALPTPVTIGGRTVQIPAIPMLGGGSVIRGTADHPVEMECCFIGSNAILEPNTYVGFGCFVLGLLGPDAGLPPFTVSTGGGPAAHQIGAALVNLASTIITHFINWTFQAVGPAGAAAVAEMTRQSVLRGLAAVEWELARRAGKNPQGGEGLAVYRSLKDYSVEQLEAGRANYRRAADGGAWDIAVRDGQLWFAAAKGCWQERTGSAFWKAGQA